MPHRAERMAICSLSSFQAILLVELFNDRCDLSIKLISRQRLNEDGYDQ